MTVSTETTKSATTVGNGVTTAFPFTFKIFQTSDVSVVLAVVATGVETVLTEGVDYSVSMNADQEADPGGEVTYPLSGSPMASTHSLTLVRDVPATQGLDLTLGGSFNPDNIEKALDRVTTLVQQLKEAVDRAFKVPVSSELTPDEFLLDSIAFAEASANAAAASAAAALVSETAAAEAAAAAEDFLLGLPTVSVVDFGAVGDGSTDDSAAFQAAIDSLNGTDTKVGAGIPSSEEGKGGIVLVPPGLWKVSAVEVKNGTYLVGSGRLNTILIPNSATEYVVKVIGSHGGVKDLSIYNKNSLASVTGLGIVPSDETDLATVLEQNYNTVSNVHIVACANGMILRCGPDVSGTDSGCWYNNIEHVTISGCTRGLWLREGPNSGASGANRNNFYAVRIGQSGTNVGIQIDDANTNSFVACAFEGIETGTSPAATPAAIYIPNSTGATSGSSSSLNKFINCEMEACTRSYDVGSGVEWLWVGGDLTGISGNGTAPDVWIDVKKTSFGHGFSSTYDAPSPPVYGTVYRNTTISAWGIFDGRSGSFAEIAMVGASVSRNSAGNYTVSFDTAMTSGNSYVVVASCDTYSASVQSTTANGFVISTTDASGETDSAKVHFIVVGT